MRTNEQQREGFGTLIRKHLNFRYEGEWVQNRATGNGTAQCDLWTYQGMWKSGKRWGFGIFTHKDGTVYQGDWANDEYEGKGFLLEPDGTSYEGEFHLNLVWHLSLEISLSLLTSLLNSLS